MASLVRLLSNMLRKLEKRVPPTIADRERAALVFIRDGTWPTDLMFRREVLLELGDAMAYCDFSQLARDPEAVDITDIRKMFNSVSFLEPPKAGPEPPAPWAPIVEAIIAEYDREFDVNEDDL